MRTILASLLIAFAAFLPQSKADTITGFFPNSDGTPFKGQITFQPKSNPLQLSTNTLIGAAITTNLSDGLLNQVLLQGKYVVSVGRPALYTFTIDVPGDGGTYQINTLSTNLGTYVYTNANAIYQTRVSTNDTNSGFLGAKLVAGSNITITTNNPTGNATLVIASTGSASGPASGDLSGNFPGPTVSQVGGITAANVATGSTAANNATSANTASTIVKRDSSGNFSAGTITANLNGTAPGAGITGQILSPQLGYVSLIPPNEVYDDGTALSGFYPSYGFTVVPGGVYHVIITNNQNGITSADFGFIWPPDGTPNGGIEGDFTNTTYTTLYVYNGDNTLAGQPVQEVVMYPTNAAAVQKLAVTGDINAANIHSSNIQGSFNGSAYISTLTVTNSTDSRLLTTSLGPPINGSGVKELPNLISVGSRLLPRLLSGTNPPVIISMGDSMADDNGGFNGVFYYLDTQLRYMFGNAGRKMASLDGFGPGKARWVDTPSANGWSVNSGSLIYGSDGTNSARSTAVPNLFCNSGGFWAWMWTNAGTVYATMTNSSGTPTTIMVNLQATNQLTNALLFHTNISFANGSNTVWYFTATSGSNYISGADWFQTNGGGIVTASWNHGGYTISNVFVGMGTNNTYALMSGVNPDIVLVHCRNNGQEIQSAISNELYVAAMAATNANSECSIVLTYSPIPPGVSPIPTSVNADMNLAAKGPPFYVLDLYDCFRSPDTNTMGLNIWGWNPHPTALGGQVAAKIAYDMMGFNYNHGFPYSTTNGNDGTSIFPASAYNQTH